ncbi:hypothetical protein GH714_013078 [Hevea brasiliensis]|uniref:Uncharacterized protein n=1 Tax=Hevea brasiliensis TaxID=3981 RepID=A0A6A6KLI1_HEVBR|nr:hypothetical protein GH714_013078 [Hevea brasiliensis]
MLAVKALEDSCSFLTGVSCYQLAWLSLYSSHWRYPSNYKPGILLKDTTQLLLRAYSDPEMFLQQPGLNVITELTIGYMYPGRPLANVAFKTYGYISMSQALMFLSDFKLGHYMKIPPKSMFIVQLVGTVIASSAYYGTAWWLLSSIKNICDPEKLPTGSPWTCPGDDVFYNASIIWGVVGPLRMFGRLGLYSKMNYFFLIGLLAPMAVWLVSRMFPEKKWIKLINIPVILSAGLDAGVAFLAILCYFTLQLKNINGPEWWGLQLDDHCPLAKCPTAPGVVAEGCPVL